MAYTFETILVDQPGDGVVRCTFNRPKVRNALNHQMVDEIHSLLTSLIADRAARALIFAGSEKCFVSGADISELRDRDKGDALRFINNGLFRTIEDLPFPTIAAIKGWALGGGCELACACDLRVAGRTARLGQPEVKLGILPGAGATYRLPRIVGIGHARDLILTGRIIAADEAFRIGLVSRLTDDDEVDQVALDLAQDLSSNGALAMRFAKMALSISGEASDRAGLYFEATAQAVTFEDQDKHERMSAFLESRKKP